MFCCWWTRFLNSVKEADWTTYLYMTTNEREKEINNETYLSFVQDVCWSFENISSVAMLIIIETLVVSSMSSV